MSFLTQHQFSPPKFIRRTTKNKYRAWSGMFLCQCGKEFETKIHYVTLGDTKSCGCLKRPHGHGVGGSSGNGTPTYITWKSLRIRCKERKGYADRGIKFDSRWLNFTNFLHDMGERPNGKTIDRIDPNGDYTKTNCRWATPKEQAMNRRKQ